MTPQPVIVVTRIVADHYGIQTSQLMGMSRERKFVWPRWVAFWLCSEVLGLPAKEIGRQYRRDHSTVLHGIQCARKKLSIPFNAMECNNLATKVRAACGVSEAFAVLRSAPASVTFTMTYPRRVDCGVSHGTVPA